MGTPHCFSVMFKAEIFTKSSCLLPWMWNPSQNRKVITLKEKNLLLVERILEEEQFFPFNETGGKTDSGRLGSSERAPYLKMSFEMFISSNSIFAVFMAHA